MSGNTENTGGGPETEGKFTDEEFTDGSHTPVSEGEDGEYTDSEIPEDVKDRPDHRD